MLLLPLLCRRLQMFPQVGHQAAEYGRRMEVATSLPIQLIQPPSSTILADNTYQRSWSLGNYRITNPTTSSDCGSKKNDLSQCPSQFTAYNTLLLLTVMSTPTISQATTTNGMLRRLQDGRNNHFWSGNFFHLPEGLETPRIERYYGRYL